MGFRAGFFGVDELRYRIEQMHPAVHLLSPTTSTGSHAVEHYGKAKDLPDLDEADRRTQCYLEHPDAPTPRSAADDPDLVASVEAVVPAGSRRRPRGSRSATR